MYQWCVGLFYKLETLPICVLKYFQFRMQRGAFVCQGTLEDGMLTPRLTAMLLVVLSAAVRMVFASLVVMHVRKPAHSV